MKYLKSFEAKDFLFIYSTIFNKLEVLIEELIDNYGVGILNDTIINNKDIERCRIKCDANKFFLLIPITSVEAVRRAKRNIGEYNYDNYFNYEDGFLKFFIIIQKHYSFKTHKHEDGVFSSIWINKERLPELEMDFNIVRTFIENLNNIVNSNKEVLKVVSNKFNI